MITPDQIRAARELLGFAIGTVSRRAKLSKVTYQDAEAGQIQLDPVRIGRIKVALERAGIEFAADGCGVTLKPRKSPAITPVQVRAARKLLGWSYATLAKKAGCRLRIVGRVEQTEGKTPEDLVATVFALQHTLEAAGVVFAAENGERHGVRLGKLI